MINNPVYVKKGGAAVDTLDYYIVGWGIPIEGETILRYDGKDVTVDDLPIAYHGGEVTFVHEFKAVKIEGNVLYLGY